MLIAVYYFEVPDLWVSSGLLDERHTATFAGHTVSLTFPTQTADFGIYSRSLDPPTWRATQITADGKVTMTYEVRVIRVEVTVDNDLKAPPEPETMTGPSAPVAERAPVAQSSVHKSGEVFVETASIAHEFAQRYIALVRTQLDQYWLEPSGIRLKLSQFIDNGVTMTVGGGGVPPKVPKFESLVTEEIHLALAQKPQKELCLI